MLQGRDQERDRIDRMLPDARKGTSAALLIHGEARTELLYGEWLRRLSPQEREVVRLAAGGATSREIATQSS